MSTSGRLKLKQAPLDQWSVKERLALASSVLRSGDQNWVSVSRAIKPYGEKDRSPEWFGQKNCALQYSNLLENVETPKRKRERGEGTGSIETPGIQIVRKLTIERIEELKQIVQEEQETYRNIKEEIELIRSGQWDDKVQDLWAEIQKEQKVKLEESTPATAVTTTPPSGTPKKKLPIKLKIPPPGIVDFGEFPSEDSTIEKSEEDSNLSQSSVSTNSLSVQDVKQTPPESPLQTNTTSENNQFTSGQVDIKQEPPDDFNKELDGANTDVNDIPLETIKQERDVSTSLLNSTPGSSGLSAVEPDPKGEKLTLIKSEKSEKLSKAAEQLKEEEAAQDSKDEDEEKIIDVEGNEEETLEDAASNFTPITQKIPPVHTGGKAVPVVVVDEDNPHSPASSVVSNDTDIGAGLPSLRGRRKERRRGRGSRRSSRLTREKTDDDGKPEKLMTDTSDDETEQESDVASKHSLNVMESVPNSPASLSQCSDTEDDKSYKVWKKSIMLVWRAAACHKFANVFLHKVTNDIAPGYQEIVHRPMELQTIKKHLETGQIRTTAEFQRDMMLMFSNAIMYNNSDHRVYKMAKEMYNDVMLHIEQFVNTQMMVNSEPKVLRTSRRADVTPKSEDKVTQGKDSTSDREDDVKLKRRPSTEQQQEHSGGGKTKKRKTRSDD